MYILNHFKIYLYDTLKKKYFIHNKTIKELGRDRLTHHTIEWFTLPHEFIYVPCPLSLCSSVYCRVLDAYPTRNIHGSPSAWNTRVTQSQVIGLSYIYNIYVLRMQGQYTAMHVVPLNSRHLKCVKGISLRFPAFSLYIHR